MSSPVSASTRYDSDEDEYEDDYDIESVEAISVGAASSDSDATIHDIPRLTLTTIHHPCVIHNLDKAVLSLGGPHALNRNLEQYRYDRSKPFYLNLRPDDSFNSRLTSRVKRINSILVEYTVPRPTGRKRKRGTNDPFVLDPNWKAHSSGHLDVRTLERAVHDNPTKSTFKAIGLVSSEHRFDGMPAFHYAVPPDSELRKIQQRLVDNLNQPPLNLNPQVHLNPDQEIPMPTGIYLAGDEPFPYNFRQNNAVETVLDENGAEVSYNMAKPDVVAPIELFWDALEVPHRPSPDLAPEMSLNKGLRRVIQSLRQLMIAQPCLSWMAVQNLLKTPHKFRGTQERMAMPYVGYTFASGPFKQLIIRFGFDPRTDPGCRFYQTVTINADSRHISVKRSGIPSRIFDGQSLHSYVRKWRICDITDAHIQKLVQRAAPRETCDTLRAGWFPNGTWAMVQTLMHDKVKRLVMEKPRDASFYDQCIERWPDSIDMDSLDVAYEYDTDDVEQQEIRVRARHLLQLELQTFLHARSKASQKLPNKESAWYEQLAQEFGIYDKPSRIGEDEPDMLDGGHLSDVSDGESVSADSIEDGFDDQDDGEEDEDLSD